MASSSRSFSATAITSESQARIVGRRKRQKVLAGRIAAAQAAEAIAADPILGSPRAGSSSGDALYQGCRLQGVVLKADDLWFSEPPNYAEGAEPAHYLPGLSEADRELLFGAVPATTAELAFDADRPAASAAAVADQGKQTETMKRILDLRNASKPGIEAVNRQRIVAEFGRTPTDTGSSEVQAALLTHQIRNLWEHIERNTRDIHNRRALRLLVHKRARVLKYYKSKDEAAYLLLLRDLGLSRSAVEGEIQVGM